MGPLHGIKVVEFAGIGPGPFAAMLLADLGAEVIRIERKEPADLGLKRPREVDYALRNRYAIQLDLKDEFAKQLVLRLVSKADALIEGFRPGVMERLGFAPDVCLAQNPRLIYGRLTGWGQTGPLAHAAGHDLNYIALTGVLHAIGRKGEPPSVPLNLIGDFAGGSLYLVVGILSAIIEAQRSGKGQVIDAAMVDGVAALSTLFHGLLRAGLFSHERGSNFIDSGSHFYDVYECADGKWISIAPVEGKFYAQLLKLLEIDIATPQLDRDSWPEAKKIMAERIKAKTRDEWSVLLEGTDVCYAPVLNFDEALEHEHMRSRGIFVDVAGYVQPGPAPRYSRSQPDIPQVGIIASSSDYQQALGNWLGQREIAEAMDAKILE